ncbi:MAG: methylmalonyl-CoA mutase small subunit [Bacteroides sp.]|nr:methylmalonyl-CoA mutase small subunit [Bacteroides sp.]MCM1413464.1 methylmalonyl-CoA mutase small subunit [Bacteroides sp.]MCM1471325.1 methylmalonyl-CoA mutase small subunit [Bacteroides sp.]
MTEKKKELLFDQFPPVSTQEWRAKVEADLKGAPFEKKLVWRTNEGFNVQPMYRAEDIADLKTTDSLPGEYPYVRGTKTDNDWLSRQEIIADNAKEANAKALDVLNKGINSLGFKVKEATEEELATLLKGITISAVELNFACCPRKALDFAKVLVAYLKKEGVEKDFKGSIDFNPFKKALKHGVEFPGDIAKMGVEMLDIVADVPSLRVLAVDSDMLSNAGAYIFEELGYAMAWGAEWMTLLTDAGVDASVVARRIKFNMGISSNYFMELAKFRAARMLWAQIAKQYGADADACKQAVHATTSRFNQTIYDAHVNLLRSQTETMSAALAGVDSITVVPFDTPYQTPDNFSERIARNQQFLLKEESHLDKVVDPAGGSYYVETLTVSIANEAWKLFIKVEDAGGFLAEVNNGNVQQAVREASEKRHTDVARRKEILLGTNQFPNINEKAADKIKTAESCGCGCGTATEEGKGLPTTRAASDFEALRLATEAAAKRPKVFMLTIGNLAMRLARAQFSTNFFGCAGYEIIDNLGFDTVEQGVDAALEKGADVVVLCSSDDEYATLAPEAFKYLDGRAEFVVAGAPACTDELKAVGINDFVHVRCNVLETLRDFNNRLLK